jgi:hypothetical protein
MKKWWLCSLISAQAFAQSTVGGGGTAVVLPDDTRVVADRYIPESAVIRGAIGRRIELSEELKTELRRSAQLLVQFGLVHPDIAYPEWVGFQAAKGVAFVEENLLSPETQYRIVPSLEGVPCDYAPPPGLDPDLPKVVFGCSRGRYTYLIEKEWEHPRLSIREKAKALWHERLRASELNGKDEIWSMLGTINRALEIGLRQINQEERGEFIPLSVEEIRELERFSEILIQNRETFFGPKSASWGHDSYPKEFKIVSGGAILAEGLKPGSSIDPSAYLGIRFKTSSILRLSRDVVIVPANNWRPEADEGIVVGTGSRISGAIAIHAKSPGEYYGLAPSAHRGCRNTYRKIEVGAETRIHGIQVLTLFGDCGSVEQPTLSFGNRVGVKESRFLHVFPTFDAYRFVIRFGDGFESQASRVSLNFQRSGQILGDVLTLPVALPLAATAMLVSSVGFQIPRIILLGEEKATRARMQPGNGIVRAVSRVSRGIQTIRYEGKLEGVEIRKNVLRNRKSIQGKQELLQEGGR